jgi:hypothetical protein
MLLCVSVVAFAACDSGTDSDEEITGLFNLRTVNGATVPANATWSTDQWDVLVSVQSGYVEINGDHSFTTGLTVSYPEGAQTVTVLPTGAGTWSRYQSAIQLSYADGDVQVGNIREDELTMTTALGGVRLVFRR